MFLSFLLPATPYCCCLLAWLESYSSTCLHFRPLAPDQVFGRAGGVIFIPLSYFTRRESGGVVWGLGHHPKDINYTQSVSRTALEANSGILNIYMGKPVLVSYIQVGTFQWTSNPPVHHPLDGCPVVDESQLS